MTAAGEQVGAEVTFTRTLDSFLECFLRRPEGEHVEMDFAQDTPYRLAPVEQNVDYQIQIDNITDIAANKLSALFDRAEPKDFVDVYFLCQEVLPFAELVDQTRNKHVGIDDYWLAVALQRVTQVEFLPRMIKQVTIEQLRSFFFWNKPNNSWVVFRPIIDSPGKCFTSNEITPLIIGSISMELTILATLAKLFGPTLARALFAAVLKDKVELTAIGSGDIAETLADSLDIGGIVDRLTDHNTSARRRADFLFDEIGEKAAKELHDVFKREGSGLDEPEQQLVLEAAQQTLNRHALHLLIAKNLDEIHFRNALRKVKPPQKIETEAQESLYSAILDRSGQILFALADRIPNFTRDTTARLLNDTNTLLDQMTETLAQLARIQEQTYGQHHATASQRFEDTYRTQLARHLDNMYIFGVDQFDGAKQPLSIAYVKLRLAQAAALFAEQAAENYGDLAHGMHEREQVVDVETALVDNQRLLVVAEAGAGKTTLLKWIALQTARYNWAGPLTSWSQRIPFYLQLRGYAKRALPTWRALPFVMKELQALEGSEPEQWVVEHLAANRGLILLDGLDEVPEEKRLESLTWLEMILSQYPETLAIVSTRPSGLVGEKVKPQLQKLGFEAVRLEHLRPEQVTDFVQQWHLAMRHDQCEFPNKSIVAEREARLLEILQRRKDIAVLTTTPLLCAMICALHLFELRDLPHDRIRLYERCINILLNRDENREIDPGNVPVRPRPETMRRLLARIAYWMMKNDPAIIRQGDALRLLRGEEGNAEAALAYLAARSVLFRQQAVDEYDFIHRTFLEFLAAEQIVREHEAALVVKTHGLSSEWHETIRLLAGHAEASDKADILAELYELARQHPAEKRTLHLLAWDFWALLDVRPNDANQWIHEHILSLNLGGVAGLDLRSTQINNLWPLTKLTKLTHLNLFNTQVNDLTPLSELNNLQQLYMMGLQISDISALTYLNKLKQLDLIHMPVSDISALSKLRSLQNLRLYYTNINDLCALEHLGELMHLAVRDVPIKDISVLSELINLQHLDLKNTHVKDISSLASLRNLRQLNLFGTQIIDISALSELHNLQQLDLRNTQVQDVSPLLDLLCTGKLRLYVTKDQLEQWHDFFVKLPHLSLGLSGIEQLSALKPFKNLRQLDLSSTTIEDASELVNLVHIEWLDLSFTRLRDVSALKGLNKLHSLNLSNTQVNTISILAGLTNLQHLNLSFTQITDISALAELTNLRQLDLGFTEISDIFVLANLNKLQQLDLMKTQVGDISVLRELHDLEHLTLAYTHVGNLSALGKLNNLKSLDIRGIQVDHVFEITGIDNLQQLCLSEARIIDSTPLRYLDIEIIS